MSRTAPLFDRQALRLHRRRAASAPADFLFKRAAADMADRLSIILRPFPVAVEVGSLAPGLGEAIGRPDLVRLGPERAGAAIVAADDALPLGEASADLIVSLLSLQFVEDLPGLLAQIRRALRADGLFLAGMIGGGSLTELRQAFTQAEAETTGGASPRVLPFVDVREAGALLQRAGFALPVADSETITVRYRDVFALMADLRAMAATNILTDRLRQPTRRATMLRMAEIYAERFADPDGRIRASFDIVWLSGWAPHESQQKPLRPGSAKMRLAEALGVDELKAGDAAKPLP